MARGEQLNALFTHEQRSENGRKGREAAEVKINGLENILITIFQELGIYAELETEAQAGQVYYADSKENRRYFYKDGIALIPDFKAKGLPIVFEVHGSGFHTRKKVEYWARIQKEPVREWKWNVTLLKAMYAERGLVCYVYWDYELREPVRREEIKQEVCAVVAKARAHLRK